MIKNKQLQTKQHYWAPRQPIVSFLFHETQTKKITSVSWSVNYLGFMVQKKMLAGGLLVFGEQINVV